MPPPHRRPPGQSRRRPGRGLPPAACPHWPWPAEGWCNRRGTGRRSEGTAACVGRNCNCNSHCLTAASHLRDMRRASNCSSPASPCTPWPPACSWLLLRRRARASWAPASQRGCSPAAEDGVKAVGPGGSGGRDGCAAALRGWRKESSNQQRSRQCLQHKSWCQPSKHGMPPRRTSSSLSDSLALDGSLSSSSSLQGRAEWCAG